MRQFPLNFLVHAISLSGFALTVSLLGQAAYAEETVMPEATLPVITLQAMSEQNPIKSYVDYKQASITRNGLDKKDIPQTIDTIDVQKYKIYGSNDLSVMLQGTPGVDTSYDMRGDGIMLRGFSADSGDIYRDGVRESGQVRRSTANIERIEILKGPASVLYGRSGGGGVINMVSKFANFKSKSTVGLYGGSYDNMGVTLDVNKVVADNWAVRLTSELGQSDSFRKGIDQDIQMVSPSVTYDNHEGLSWTAQYTYDQLNRIPDRGPSFDILPAGTSIKTGFAQDGDHVEDTLQVVRSDLNYEINQNWKFHWAASYREAEQNFDHFYLGSYCAAASSTCLYANSIKQIYYWQQTANKTLSNTFDIQGDFVTGKIQHHLTVGFDYSYEEREPKLANTNQNGSAIYGYVNPITGERFSSRGTGPLKMNTHNYNEGTSYGLFAQDVITLLPQLKLLLGVRFDSYENSTTNKLLSASDTNHKRTVKDDSISPNVGIVWQPVEAQSIYASYSKSFAPFGGSVGVSAVSASQDLAIFNSEPQYNEQYEIGIKSDWLNKKLNTQFSVYNIEKNNIRYRPDPNILDEWAVAGRHQSQGAEFSFIGRLNSQLHVRGGYGYMKADVQKDLATPLNVGKSLAGTSEETGNLFVRYLPVKDWYGEVGLTHVGDSWTNLTNTTKLKGFNRVDAAIGYSASPWNATLAISNLTNKQYWRSSSMPGTRLSVLLRASYQF